MKVIHKLVENLKLPRADLETFCLLVQNRTYRKKAHFFTLTLLGMDHMIKQGNKNTGKKNLIFSIRISTFSYYSINYSQEKGMSKLPLQSPKFVCCFHGILGVTQSTCLHVVVNKVLLNRTSFTFKLTAGRLTKRPNRSLRGFPLLIYQLHYTQLCMLLNLSKFLFGNIYS